MAGYARQSSSSIQDGETITAAPLNSEFDAVLAAFAFSGGHNHDGSSTEGSYVGILADVDALNKVVVDTSNNRHGFFVQVSSSAVEQLRIQDGAIVPVTSNDIDLGTSSLQFKDIHIDGTAYVDTLEIHVGASLSAGVLSLPDGTASAPVITNTGDTNQGLYFSGTDEMSFTAGGTAQVTFADGVIKPVTDNDVDLGTSSLQFKDIHINGTANIDTLAGTTMSGDLAMGSNSITGLAAPSADGDAARKVYVDDAISNASNLTQLGGNINVNGSHFFGSSGEDIKFKPVGSASILSTQDNDGEFVALVLRNESDAADTTGIASLRFDLEDTGGNTVDAAKIAVKKEESFTATAATQDSSMVFSTSLNGTLTEYLKLTSAGILEPITDDTVDIGTATKEIKNIFVDGTAYIDAIGFGTTSVALPGADGSANQILKTNGSGTISWANDTGTTINNATENELVTVASTTTQLDGESNLTFDGTTLTLNGKLAMASNTAGKLLIADGTDFEPTAVGDLGAVSSVANDDVLLIVDTSGGGLKKITRSTLVAGLATSSAISDIVEDTTPQLGGNLDAQGKSITDAGILGYSYGASGSPTVVTVTVASKTSGHPYNGDGSSSAYFLDGAESPAIKLNGADSVTSSSGYYYKFDQAESSNNGHPLRFYLDAAKTIAYTTGVTTSGTPGSSGAHTTIAVTDQTPSTLYYQCSSHAYMGNYASVDSANITSSGAVSIDAVGDITLDADGGDIVFKDAGTTFGSATNTSGNLIIKSGTTTALTFSGANATAAGNLILTGDLTVNGTTTTVNSTTVTIDDPIFTLGGDGNAANDDNKDRGIEFKWHTGSAAKVGFFGYDDSASAFTFIPDATNSSEVFSGTVGNAIFGNITGTLQTAAQTNITSTGALGGGSIAAGFGAIDNGTSGIRTNIFTVETSIVPDESGGADLGSASLEWGDLYIADDKKISLGSDQDFTIEYDEDGNDTTAVVAAGGLSLAPYGTSAGNGTELRFQELAANGAHYVGFKAPDSVAANKVFILPNADGSADQVLKTDGSLALDWVDQAGGGTVDRVADGAIAIRKPVILTSAGKAKQVAEAGGASNLTGANYLGVSAAAISDGATGKIIVPGGLSEGHSSLTIGDHYYTNGAGAVGKAGSSTGEHYLGKAISATEILLTKEQDNYIHATANGAITVGKGVVINSSGDAEAITAAGKEAWTKGTKVDLNGNGMDNENTDIQYDTSSNKFGLAIVADGSPGLDAGKGAFYVITQGSDGAVTVTDPVVFHDYGAADGCDAISLAYDPITERFALQFREFSNSNYGIAMIAKIVGTTVSFGVKVIFESSNIADRSTCAAGAGKMLVTYKDANDNKLKSKLGTIAAETLLVQFAAEVEVDANSGWNNVSCSHDTAQNKFVVQWYRANVARARVATVATSSVTQGFANMDGSDKNAQGGAAAYHTASGKYAIAYADGSNSNYGTLVSGTLNLNGTVTWGTPVVYLSSGQSGTPSIAEINGRIVISYKIGSTSVNLIATTNDALTTFGSTVVVTVAGDSSDAPANHSMTADTTSNYAIVAIGGISSSAHATYIRPAYIPSGTGAIVMGGTAYGPYAVGNQSENGLRGVHDPDTNRTIIPYKKKTSGSVYKAAVRVVQATGSTSSPTLTVGDEVFISDVDATSNTSKCSMGYDPVNDKVFAISQEGTSDYVLKGYIGTVTGGTTNSISFAGDATIHDPSNNIIQHAMAYNVDQEKFFVFYTDRDDGNDLKYRIITPGASSFSVANAVEVTTAEQKLHSQSAIGGPSGKGILLAGQAQDDSDYLTYVTLNYFAQISYGSENSDVGGGNVQYPEIVYDSAAEKHITVYRTDDSPYYGWARIGTVSGSTISFGSAVMWSNSQQVQFGRAAVTNTGAIAIHYKNNGDDGANYVVYGKISGTSISFGDPFKATDVSGTNAAITSAHCIAYNPDEQRFLAQAYANNVADNFLFTSRAVMPNSENFVGIATKTVANDAQAELVVMGGEQSGYTGLTAGSDVYVGTDGTISSTASDPSVVAGKALSANKILIKA